MTRDDFTTAYAGALRDQAAVDDVNDYAYLAPAGRAETVAERMTASLAVGTASVHDSPVLRRLARAYGIPHTNDGWRTFVASLT